MSEPSISIDLCRLCCTEGHFKSLDARYILTGKEKNFLVLLHETFNINLAQVPTNQSFSICGVCEERLQDAALFKKQVLDCEKRFFQGLTDGGGSEKEVKVEFNNSEEASKSLEILVDPSLYMYDQPDSPPKIPIQQDSSGHDLTPESQECTNNAEDSGNQYSCSFCKKQFPDTESLETHMKTGEKPCISIINNITKAHFCNICNRYFSSRSCLVVHQRKHTGERPYKCDVCKKNFAAHTSLQVHKRVHTGLKPYSCTICERTFTQLSTLKLHMTTHTDMKPFSCEICHKTFADIRYLKKHMLVHSGEKPFSCEVCDRKFSEKAKVKRHMAIHSGIKGRNCKICKKHFADMYSHMKVHNKE